MQTESTTKSLSAPNDVDQRIHAAESTLKLSLDEYKLITVDQMHHQHTIIKNYLWLSATFVAAEAAMFSQMFPKACGAVIGTLYAATVLSVIALFAGIRSMTGTDFGTAIPNGIDTVERVCPQGGQYSPDEHLAFLRETISQTESEIDVAFISYGRRLTIMRAMNWLLTSALLLLSTAGGLYFVQLTS